jgi:hypothetical protein
LNRGEKMNEKTRDNVGMLLFFPFFVVTGMAFLGGIFAALLIFLVAGTDDIPLVQALVEFFMQSEILIFLGVWLLTFLVWVAGTKLLERR